MHALAAGDLRPGFAAFALHEIAHAQGCRDHILSCDVPAGIEIDHELIRLLDAAAAAIYRRALAEGESLCFAFSA